MDVNEDNDYCDDDDNDTNTADAALDELCDALLRLPADPENPDENTYAMSVVIDGLGGLLVGSAQEPLCAVDARQLRARLWATLVRVSSTTLCAPIQLCAPEPSDTPVDPRRADMMSFGQLALLALTALLHRRAPSLDDSVRRRRVVDMQWLCAQRLVPAQERLPPVLEYSQAELLDCVQSLRWAFVTARYHAQLVELVELVELSAARLLHTSGNANVFDLPDARCALGDGLYHASQEFCQALWPCLLGMHRRLLVARTLGEPVDSPPVDRAARRRLRRRLVALAQENNFRDASPSLATHLVQAHVQPGARELYQMRQHGGADVSDKTIVGDELADTIVADLQRRARFTPAVCLSEQMPADDGAENDNGAEHDESLELQLCAHDVLNMATTMYAGCAWARYYARFEQTMVADDVQREAMLRPMLVHLFNRWQLMYERRVYFFNSFIDSLWFWLLLLRRIPDEHVLDADYRAARRSDFFRRLADYVLGPAQ